MNIQEVRNFLDACHEVQRFMTFFPELPKGLSQRHIKVLQAVRELSGEARVKISDISDYMGGTRPSITRLIRELEAKGALTKTQDTEDKRIIWLALTDLGEQYYEFYCRQYHTWLAEILGEIPPEDFDTTIHTIQEVSHLLQGSDFPQYQK